MAVDWKLVAANYANLKHVADVMSPQWLERMRKKNCVHHPLIELLSIADDVDQARLDFERARSEIQSSQDIHLSGSLENQLKLVVIPPRMQRILALEHLDSCLGQLFKNSDPLCYRKEIENEPQFWDVYSEIECAANTSKSNSIELKPKAGGRRLDYRLSRDGLAVLVEVRATKLPLALRRSAAFVKDRIPNILRKEAKQFQGLPKHDKTPCVLIIDTSGSEIDSVVSTPDADAIPSQISAVLLYKMDFWWDAIPHYWNRVHVINEKAKRPISDSSVRAALTSLPEQ
jgi:hypothetical protein